MHKYHKQAEKEAREIISELQRMISNDGEDISYYNPGAMNDLIRKLIDVKVLLALANEAQGKN